MTKKLGQGNAWDKAFLANKKGSFATRDRAFKTWAAVKEFSDRKKWDLTPETISPKQLRIFLEERATKLSARSVQNEASHIRRAIEGSGRDIGNVRDPKNSWSSARLSVPSASRIGGKAAADPEKYAVARGEGRLASDISAGTILSESIGLREKEMIMSGRSLDEWTRDLQKEESKVRGVYLNVIWGTKGDKPRWTYIHPSRVEKAIAAVAEAAESARMNPSGYGHVIHADTLKDQKARYSNALYQAGLRGDDSGHGLRRLFAQDSYRLYREAGHSEKDALRRLSVDLGHGEGRGRWVWNNYLSGGSGAETRGDD